MAQSPSFAEMVARLQAGDPNAASEVFNRFARRLIGLARLHLDGRLRRKVDPEDILQSAFKSFFLRHADGQWTLQGWDSLWALLALITVRKCGKWVDYLQAGCRDIRLEKNPPESDFSAVWAGFAREPTPDEVVALAEAVENLLGEQSPRDREIVTLALQGYTSAEISEQLNRPQRTIQRVLQRVRKRLQRLQALEADGG